MKLSDFRSTLTEAAPPPFSSPLLRALWLDAKGDFDGAHVIAQETSGKDAAHVHAYLHRKEEDIPNARYWCRLAGVPAASGALEHDWEALVERRDLDRIAATCLRHATRKKRKLIDRDVLPPS